MTYTPFRGSTALALVMALSVSPHQIALAQDGDAAVVDCAADPANPACAEAAPDPQPPAEPAPSVDNTVDETSGDAAPEPAAEEPAPTEESVAQEPEVETPAVAAEPVVDEPAVEEPPAEDPPAEDPPAEEPPVEEPPADEPPVEEPPAEEPPAEEPPAEEPPADEPPVEEPPAEDPPVEEPPAEEPPAAETPAAEPAPEEAMEAEDAAAEPDAPSADQVPAAEEPPAATADEPPAATAEEPPAATAEEPAQDEPAAQSEAPQEDSAPDTSQDGQTLEAAPDGNAEAAADPDVPATVIPDETTDAQRAAIEAAEQARREEARLRRIELLGAAAAGAGIGMLIPALGGTVVEDQGDRIIVERDGEYFVRKDESSLLRDGDVEVRVERLRNGRTRETVTRLNGVQIVSVRDQGGYLLYRSRILPDGREYVLVDNRDIDDRAYIDFDDDLPPLRVGVPLELYIVPAGRVDYDIIVDTFAAPPVEEVERAYTLRQVRESERLRDKVRRVDLDTITFETGSATVRQSQVPLLEDIARASIAVIERDPSTVLLIEGHTDAVGTDVDNLALSDRRAETVARILADVYGVPPENMVIQGYGEQYLKVDTEAAEERNRRVTIRNITPLLSAGQ